MTPRANAAPSSFAKKAGLLLRPFLAALLMCALPILNSSAFQLTEREKAPSEPLSLARESVEPSRLAALGIGLSADQTGGSIGLLFILAAGEHPDFSAWSLPGVMGTPAERARVGALSLVGGVALPASSVVTSAILIAGEHLECWRFLDTDRVSPIRGSLRDLVRDRTPVASTVQDGQAYWNTVYQASQTADIAFRAASQTGWRLRALEKDPASSRGEVFYLEGKLQNVKRLPILRMSRGDLVADPYVGELTDASGNLSVIHFAELPPGVNLDKVTEFQASFAGYFFKLFPRPNGAHVPLFIGRTFRPLTPLDDRLPQATTALLLSCQAGPGEETAPLTALALLQATEHLNYWKLYAATEVPTLRRDLLLQVRDKGFFPTIGEDDADFGELQAYYDFLIVASRTPLEYFGINARDDVSYAQLIRQPSEFRGELIHLEGNLKQLLRHNATKDLQRNGIPFLYEAWIYDPDNVIRPYCVVLTELPEGLHPSKKMTKQVSCDAYFFKRGDLASADLKEGKRRMVPLLVGRSLKVITVHDIEEGFGDSLLKGSMIFLLLTGITIVFFTVWYRRNDHRVLMRIKAVRTGDFVPPPPDAVPMAAPVAEPIKPPSSAGESESPNGNHGIAHQRSLRPQQEAGGGWADDPSRN